MFTVSRWEVARFRSFLAALFSAARTYNMKFEEQTNSSGSSIRSILRGRFSSRKEDSLFQVWGQMTLQSNLALPSWLLCGRRREEAPNKEQADLGSDLSPEVWHVCVCACMRADVCVCAHVRACTHTLGHLPGLVFSHLANSNDST